MGMEHRGKGSDMQLGPVVGPIGRVPAGGRGWEGFSPDPVLSGIAVAQTVKGTQSAGVMACTKHLVSFGKCMRIIGNISSQTGRKRTRTFPTSRRGRRLWIQYQRGLFLKY